jgi:hypothetical protein
MMAIGAAAVGLAVLPVQGAFAKPGNGNNPEVLPPNAKPYGKTYGEWSAEWWKWAFSLPVAEHPLFEDNSCNYVAEGQSGKVWFLGGVFNVSGTATRNCTVPAGKALFFPIINTECSTLEGNGDTEQALRDCATEITDTITNADVEIDGVSLRNVQQKYRADSPLFTYGPLPADNFLGAAAGATSPSVADGFYIMLAPLSVGEHTIHFTGTYGDPINFTLDITYNLTVVPPKQAGI